MVKKSFEKWSSRNQTYFRMRFKNDSWIFFQFKVFFLNQQKILRSSSSDQNLNLNGCRPIIRVIWMNRKWPDPCHVNPRGMTCIPLSFTPRIYLTNQRHVQQNDCITKFYEKFNSRFQTNKNHLWRHQSALRVKGLAWYSTDVYGFFSKLDDKFTFWTWNVLL